MTKPTPIDKWIEEKWPENEFDPVVDFDDYILNSTSKQAARETAHYILEELGVLECLENNFNCGGCYPVDHCTSCDKRIEETLKKLKGEPQ